MRSVRCVRDPDRVCAILAAGTPCRSGDRNPVSAAGLRVVRRVSAPTPGEPPPGPDARFGLRAASRAAMLGPRWSDRWRRLPGVAWTGFRSASAPASLEPVLGAVGIGVAVSLPGRSRPGLIAAHGRAGAVTGSIKRSD